uniref:Dentin sialophosphoprotein n=1 Tax=Globodera pallida TaxID=36090 RepID=A0A183CJB2_GLOPA
MLLNLKCIVLPLLALYTVNTVLSAWAAESRATKDGTSSAVGTASTIGTFEQHHHHRRWRRGNSGGHPSLGSLRRGALRSKSGQSVADEILPIDGTDNKSSSWFDNIKRTLKPPSRLTHDEVIETVRTHQQRLALEVVLAQNVKQLHTRKELLKMALFYEQTLNLFSNELIKQENILQMATGHLKLTKQKSGNNFFGLQITFDSSIASTFDESADFEPIEESKKKSLLKTFKHNLRTAVRPYSSRSPETHLKELEAKNTKLSWDILKAINQEKRIKAQESIKLAVYLMMSINIAHSAEVEAKIDEAKKAVAGQSRALKDAEKKHKHAHCCSSSSHNSQDERNLSRNSSRRRQKRNPTDEDSESDDDVKKGDDGENGEDGESDDDVKKSEDGENGEDGESDDDVKKGEDGENGEDGESAEDVESDEDAESDEDVESDEDEHFDNDEEEQNSDSDPSSSPMFASGSFNRKEKESRAMSPLTKSRSYSSNRSTSGHNSVSSGSPKLKRCPTKQKTKIQKDLRRQYKDDEKASVDAEQAELRRHKRFDNGENPVINTQIEDAESDLIDLIIEKLVEKHMREVFAKGPGKQFLLNMIELSKQLTVFEIRRCVEKFSWFRGFKVQINKKQFTLNGRGKEPPVRPQTTGEHQYNLESEEEAPSPQVLSRASSYANTSSTQRSAGGSRRYEKSKSTNSGGKRHHKRR